MVVSVIPPNFGRMKTGGRVAKYVNCELIEALKFMAPYDPFWVGMRITHLHPLPSNPPLPDHYGRLKLWTLQLWLLILLSMMFYVYFIHNIFPIMIIHEHIYHGYWSRNICDYGYFIMVKRSALEKHIVIFFQPFQKHNDQEICRSFSFSIFLTVNKAISLAISLCSGRVNVLRSRTFVLSWLLECMLRS